MVAVAMSDPTCPRKPGRGWGGQGGHEQTGTAKDRSNTWARKSLWLRMVCWKQRSDMPTDIPPIRPTKKVCTDTTGYRETVEVRYDADTVSLQTLLGIFFLCIDPTVTNRQGEDIGSQYQTGVYYTDEESRKIIEEYFAKEREKHERFCTELAPLQVFYPAEEYHQDYLIKNPEGYCHISLHEMQKVKEFLEAVKGERK